MIKSSIKGLIPGLTTLILSFFLIATANADPVKVGFVYIGPVGDHGWTYRHDIGRQQVEEALGEMLELNHGVAWFVLCAEEFSEHAEFDVSVALLVSTDDFCMLLVVSD